MNDLALQNEVWRPVSLVLPVHNEASIIEHVLSSYVEQIGALGRFEILIAEDGSTDGTELILRRLLRTIPNGVLVSNRARQGYGKAVRDAVNRAKFNLVFFSDSDGQYFPSDFRGLYAKVNDHDLIVGKKLKRIDPFHRILLARAFHLLVRLLFHIRLSDCDCGYRLMRSKVVQAEANKVRHLKHSYWAEFTIRAVMDGFRVVEVPISHQHRLSGSTQLYEARRLPRIILDQLVGLLLLKFELRGKRLVRKADFIDRPAISA